MDTTRLRPTVRLECCRSGTKLVTRRLRAAAPTMGLVVTATNQLGILQSITVRAALVSILERRATTLGTYMITTCGRPVQRFVLGAEGLAETRVWARSGLGMVPGIVVSTIRLIGFRGTSLGGCLMAPDTCVVHVAAGMGSAGYTGGGLQGMLKKWTYRIFTNPD